MNAVILHDAITTASTADEADVLVQAKVVERALKELGHTSTRLAFSLDLAGVAGTLRQLAPDFVINLVESVEGHGRLIHLAPSLLEALRIPYAGCPGEAIYTTSNKLLAKTMLRGAGIDTPSWYTLGDLKGGEFVDSPVPRRGRYILKSVWEHASRGIDDDSVIDANEPEELASVLESQSERLAGEGFAEAYIEGREFNLAFLAGGENGVRALPPAEIRFIDYAPGKPKIVGYKAKWAEGSFEFENTPRRFDFPKEDAPLLDTLVGLGLRCWRLFRLRGWARVDFRVDAEGRAWVLEVNSNPCLSPDAGYAAALKRAGVSLTEAMGAILSDVPAIPTAPRPLGEGLRA